MGPGPVRDDLPDAATPLDPDESADLIPTWIGTLGALNEAEAANIATAIVWLESRSWTLDEVLEVEWLFRLHERMFSDVWRWAGKARLTGKNIGVPAADVRPQVTNLVADAKVRFSTPLTDPTPNLAAFHHRLVWIHAFPKGNGRHAREATNALARSAGYDAPSWGGKSLDWMGEPRATYIAALRAADNGDLEPLVTFMRL